MPHRARILSQIAEALAAPVEGATKAGTDADGRFAPLAEYLELIVAFRQIADRQARRRCLSYVRATAERSAETA